MMSALPAIRRFFAEPPAAPTLPEAEIPSTYRRWRTRMLLGSLIGYGMFYFVRKNIPIALPLLAKELGYTKTQLGRLGSLLYISYGCAKALFGIVSDRVNPRTFMAFGLMASAALNVGFSLSNTLFAFSLFWLLNGLVQAMGAPPCAKICVRWFSISERGTKWGIWNISHQAGGGLILIIAGWFAALGSWRTVFWGPAVLGALGAVFIWYTLRDRPEELGLPPIDIYRNDPEGREPGDATRPLLSLVLQRVLLNPRLLLLALTSLCVYIVRYGTLDWAPTYLVEAKGHSISIAGPLTSLIEFGGIPGMLLSGWLSDRVFGARRAPVVVISLLALAASMIALYLVPPGHSALDGAALFTIGFFTYGPQMLVAGVAAADTCGAEVAAAAVGITGLFSYAGAIVASSGTGIAVDRFGWHGAFVLWVTAALAGALLLTPQWGLRGRSAA